MEEYYVGNLDKNVRRILNEVVVSLQKYSKRRFVYVEQLYFQTWWNEQTQETQRIVRKLIQNSQLEFLNGGYVMNDEGCTYYDDIIADDAWP